MEIVDDTVIREEKRLENTVQRRLDQSYQASKMLRMNRRSGFSVSLSESVAFFPDKRDRATQPRLGIHSIKIRHSLFSHWCLKRKLSRCESNDARRDGGAWTCSNQLWNSFVLDCGVSETFLDVLSRESYETHVVCIRDS